MQKSCRQKSANIIANYGVRLDLVFACNLFAESATPTPTSAVVLGTSRLGSRLSSRFTRMEGMSGVDSFFIIRMIDTVAANYERYTNSTSVLKEIKGNDDSQTCILGWSCNIIIYSVKLTIT